MANKKLAAISVILTIIALTITASTFAVDTWVYWEQESGDVNVGLYFFTESDSSTEGMSWDCFNKLYCSVLNSWDEAGTYEQGLCDQPKMMFRAANLYWVFNLIAFVFMILHINSQTAIISNADPGQKSIIIGFNVLYMLFSLIGFSCWWGITQVSYNAECDKEGIEENIKDGERWDVWPGAGASLSIVAFIITTIASAIGVVSTLYQKSNTERTLVPRQVFGILVNTHLKVIIFITGVCILFIVVSLCLDGWFNFRLGWPTDRMRGSLQTVNNWFVANNSGDTFAYASILVSRYGIDCITVSTCDQDSDHWKCNTFKPIFEASKAYLSIEIVSAGCMLVSSMYLLYAVLFNKDQGCSWLNYVFPHLTWILHMIALIVWSVKTEAHYSGTCDNIDLDHKDRADICATAGPVLSIIILIIQTIIACYFTIIYYKRGESVELEYPALKTNT